MQKLGSNLRKDSFKENSYYRASAYRRDIDIANMYVRPSVRYVLVSDENGLTYRQFFSPYGSPITLVLPVSNIFTKFRRGHTLRGAKYRWGINLFRFSTNKSLYLANYTRYRHSYYKRRKENRTVAFEWYQFE